MFQYNTDTHDSHAIASKAPSKPKTTKIRVCGKWISGTRLTTIPTNWRCNKQTNKCGYTGTRSVVRGFANRVIDQCGDGTDTFNINDGKGRNPKVCIETTKDKKVYCR